MRNAFSIPAFPARRALFGALRSSHSFTRHHCRGAGPFRQRQCATRGHAEAGVSYWALVGANHDCPGPGEPLHLTQSENVEFKLGGLVLLIEGKSTGADGKAQFEALATVAFDNASRSYRFRAYHDGNYLDTPLTVHADGFSWEYSMGPAKVVNTMHLTSKGEWQEKTDVTLGNNPPRPSMEILLSREP